MAGPTGRGEFTRKFDREILGDESAAKEEEEIRQRLASAEEKALEEEFLKIMEILEYRSAWIKNRFEGCVEPGKLGFRGRRFEFKDDDKLIGWLEFRTRLTDSQQAIMIQSFMQLEGQFDKRCDYVTFPKEKVNGERAKKFIESKIMEFAGPLQAAFGNG
jgi:hypothetical protein